ncbi:MAG: hypothetical protein ACRDNK_18430, partial [Solirubrobacteraceae bacterium]
MNGAEQPVSRHGMPRLDLFRSLHPTLDPFATKDVELDESSAEDPRLHSYLSGFWGVVRIPSGLRGACELSLRARLEGGELQTVALGAIPIQELS